MDISGPKTILIVDDDPDVRFMLSSYFQAKGYATVAAEDGSGVLELIAERRPSLITLDVMMPDKNGLEVCRELRALGLRTPIVMLSTKSAATDPEGVARAGADAYVDKPFDLNHLERTVRALLTRPVKAR